MAKAFVPPQTKRCKECGEVRPATQFHIAKLNRDGLHTTCKTCRRTESRKHYDINSCRIKARANAYYANNREICIERVSAYYVANKIERDKQTKAWRKRNWDRLRPIFVAARNARDAHIKRATPAWADLSKIKELHVLSDRVTLETGVPHDVDHIVPLRGKTVCGLHVHYNMRVIPSSENKRKHNRLTAEAPLAPKD